MQRLSAVLLVLAVSAVALALAGSAAGTTPSGAKIRHFPQPIEAVAIDGKLLAYAAASKYVTTVGAINKVLVWNVTTGKTVKVSGKKTAVADDTSTGAGVFELAVAGTRVAWAINEGGNSEGDDYVYTSSVTSPKERRVASTIRYGDSCAGRSANCAGNWLGGVVGSGKLLAANRWTTDAAGTITAGSLDLLNGAKLKQIATGPDTVEAVSADAGRLAVLHPDGTVGLYSSTGKSLRTITPSPAAKEVALSGNNLVVLRLGGTIALYNAKTGALRKTLAVHGSAAQADDLDAEGTIAIYTTGCQIYQSCAKGQLRAVNLSNGKDRLIGTLAGGIGHGLAHIDAAGLAYAGNGWHSTYGKGTLVFVPLAKVAKAVS